MVPGQVITEETITCTRKLAVEEAHGYLAARGLKQPQAGRARDAEGEWRAATGAAVLQRS
jgi:hypothetical protein